MIDGRILSGTRFRGSAFALTDRLVATAAHVVRDQPAAELTFVTAGWSVQVQEVRVDPSIDAAILRVAESLPVVPPLAHAQLHEQWRVTSRPQKADSQLTGAVRAIDHMIVNAGDHDMTVLQLHVAEELRDYSGYSGSAVVVNDSIVGLLVEQVRERAAAPGSRPMAANVLYAVPVDRLVARFRLNLKVERPSAAAEPRQLLNTAYFDLDVLKNAILDARTAATDRMLALGIPVQCTDMKVVENLRDWLPAHFGEFEPKGQLTLRAEVNSVERVVGYVARYRQELDRVNVFCPILVDAVPAEHITRFIDEVRSRIGPHRKWIVLLLVGEPADGFPEPVVALPQPRFVPRDVNGWASNMIALRRWPSPLAAVWRGDRSRADRPPGPEDRGRHA
ncbi:serine protease [Actinoplanes sp. NPDC026623]|uniref:S1 family peptidase n=1 Tax=Actinoplanes sp. NPDC026623 TaxID=3155610 RepID=UPI0033C86BCB